MRYTLTAVLALAFALSAASPAAAANPFYLAGKLGNSTQEASVDDAFGRVLDGDDDSWSGAFGLKLGKHFAFQLEYHDFGTFGGFGSPCPRDAEACIATIVPLEADSTGLSLSVLPHWNFTDRLSAYLKAGIVSWESDIKELTDVARRDVESLDDEDLLYGLGVRFAFPGPFGAFAEYERIADEFDSYALGATFGF